MSTKKLPGFNFSVSTADSVSFGLTTTNEVRGVTNEYWNKINNL